MKMNSETLALLNGIYAQDGGGFGKDDMGVQCFKSWGVQRPGLQKAITTAYGLVAIDLQAPSKELFPTLSPIRNRMPRVKGSGGLSTQWRSIKSISNASGAATQAFVPEGQRSAAISYATANVAASYATLGTDDFITFEAVSAAESYEDLRSTMTRILLQKMMVNEEYALLDGNVSVVLGTPATPALSQAGTTGTLPTVNPYSVIVVALTAAGFNNSSVVGGVKTQSTLTGMDGLTYPYNFGSSNKSAAQTLAITLGQILSASVTPIKGAAGYAWFVGAVGSETLQAITSIATVSFSVPLTGGQQPVSQITQDCSANVGLEFDGLLSIALNPANLAYTKDLGAATLTASSRGSVNEIDAMIKTMWDTYRLGIDVLYVNSQEQVSITNKCLNASSGPLLRINTDGKEPGGIMGANEQITMYYNPFVPGGGKKFRVEVHPYMTPGTMLGLCENLPAYYMSNSVPQVAEVHCRRDYYEQEYPIRTRRYEHGVYAEEVLAVYATFGVSVMYNIAAG